jgi:hypothetical protein
MIVDKIDIEGISLTEATIMRQLPVTLRLRTLPSRPLARASANQGETRQPASRVRSLGGRRPACAAT